MDATLPAGPMGRVFRDDTGRATIGLDVAARQRQNQ